MIFKELKRNVYLLWNSRTTADNGMLKSEWYINKHKISYSLFERYKKILDVSTYYTRIEIKKEEIVRKTPSDSEEKTTKKTVHTYWRTF